MFISTESSNCIPKQRRLSRREGKPLAGRRTKILCPSKNGSIDVHSMTFDAVGYLKQYRSGKSSFCARNRSSRMPNHICTDYLFMLDLSPVLFVCEGVMQISCSFHSFFLPSSLFPRRYVMGGEEESGIVLFLDRKVISVHGVRGWLARITALLSTMRDF